MNADAKRAQQRVNCRVVSVSNGSKQLIFEVAGTKECVGEMHVIASDPCYMPVIAQLFTKWVAQGAQSGSRLAPVPDAIRRAINGH